jgi:hypothetical protein
MIASPYFLANLPLLHWDATPSIPSNVPASYPLNNPTFFDYAATSLLDELPANAQSEGKSEYTAQYAHEHTFISNAPWFLDIAPPPSFQEPEKLGSVYPWAPAGTWSPVEHCTDLPNVMVMQSRRMTTYRQQASPQPAIRGLPRSGGRSSEKRLRNHGIVSRYLSTTLYIAYVSTTQRLAFALSSLVFHRLPNNTGEPCSRRNEQPISTSNVGWRSV